NAAHCPDGHLYRRASEPDRLRYRSQLHRYRQQNGHHGARHAHYVAGETEMAVVSPSRRDALAGLRTFKPGRCEVVHRVFSPGAGRYAMSFGVLVPLVLSRPGRKVELEEFTSIWEYAADILPEGEILDEAWPKPQGEFLGAGHCYPPQGHTGQPVSASISVGRLSKRLAVYGRRHVTAT